MLTDVMVSKQGDVYLLEDTNGDQIVLKNVEEKYVGKWCTIRKSKEYYYIVRRCSYNRAMALFKKVAHVQDY